MPYTPIFDSLFNVPKINLTDAATFGAVWRYAQGKLKKCTASPETIGERIGLSHNPVRKSLKKLCNLGLLVDLTPTVNYKVHEYAPTEKALKIIAGKAEEEAPISNERLPESGNLNVVTQDDRLPESGNLGYQNQVGRLPESGNLGYQNQVTKKEVIIESIEQEETPAQKDYLETIVNGIDSATEATASNPDDQWFEYRDKALRAFPGDWGRTIEEKEIKKNLITGFVANNPKFNPEHWSFIIQDCIGHGVSSNNIARFIEVYPFKNYDDYLASRYRAENGRDSPPKPKYITIPVTQERDDNG